VPYIQLRVWTAGGLLLLALAAVGCGGSKPAPIKAIATREDVMHHMVIPNAQLVWNASGTIFSAKGTEERHPKSDDDWFNVESAAITLMEAGNLLMMDGRAMDNGHWMDHSRALREAGDALRLAAKAKDVDALFDKGGVLFDSCQACHFEYRFQYDPKIMRTH
jgi:hypothetical protein